MKNLLILIGLCFFTFGCEEVITLDLNQAQEKYVIEANLSNLLGGAKVSLSKTKSFDSSNSFAGVSGAIVEIIDEQNNITVLNESTTKGVYIHSTLFGLPGKTYRLRIEINNKVFTSICTMPSVVPLDDAYPLQMNLSGKTQWYSQVRYKDPKNIENFYRFIEHRNSIIPKSVFVTNDELTDGKSVIQTVFSSDHSVNSKIKPGETVRLEFLCIAKPVYKYWFSINSGAKGNSDNAAPSNPISNIEGGAIGYFSAHTSQSKTYTVR